MNKKKKSTFKERQRLQKELIESSEYVKYLQLAVKNPGKAATFMTYLQATNKQLKIMLGTYLTLFAKIHETELMTPEIQGEIENIMDSLQIIQEKEKLEAGDF